MPTEPEKNSTDPKPNAPASDEVWTFRGYHLRSSEFTTAMVHLFRAEISRANVWRQRLDTTTNWAVVSTGASITFAFSQASGHHGVILLNTLLITLFLLIEARRYRYYEVWSARIRLMETDFFAGMLVPPFGPSPDWAESMAENLLQPHYPISRSEAIGRRYRRNYLWIFILLAIAWGMRIWLLPTPAASWAEFISRASIGSIPGEVVVACGMAYQAFWALFGLLTFGMREASGEVLPRYAVRADAKNDIPDGTENGSRWEPWFRHSERRRQLLAMVITDHGDVVSAVLLKELKRGVTALDGRGMYTGQARSVLLVALTVTEVNHLKVLVRQADAQAFVIVSPAQEILGKGFVPLRNKAPS